MKRVDGTGFEARKGRDFPRIAASRHNDRLCLRRRDGFREEPTNRLERLWAQPIHKDGIHVDSWFFQKKKKTLKKPSPSKASTAILMVPEDRLAGHVVCLRACVDIAIILSGAKV